MCRQMAFIILVLCLASGLANAKPLNQDPGPDGIVSVEAEHYDNKEPGQNGTGWEEIGPTGGFTGELGMQVANEGSNDTWTTSASGSLFQKNLQKKSDIEKG